MKYLDLLQYIVIQQEIKDSDCYDTLFISIRFDIIFHDYNFLKKSFNLVNDFFSCTIFSGDVISNADWI